MSGEIQKQYHVSLTLDVTYAHDDAVLDAGSVLMRALSTVDFTNQYDTGIVHSSIEGASVTVTGPSTW